MSDGTWEDLPDPADPETWPATLREALVYERQGLGVHYSACDELCEHGGPWRARCGNTAEGEWDTRIPVGAGARPGQVMGPGVHEVEASWRPVDVRTLSWPHDLRPEQLALLCLRCWAARGAR